MQFALAGLLGLVASVAANPLQRREFRNETSSAQIWSSSSTSLAQRSASASASASASVSAECLPGQAICSSNIIQRCVNGRYQPGNCVDNLAGYPGSVAARCITSSPDAKDGVCALPPYNHASPLGPASSSSSSMGYNSTSTSASTVPTITAPPAKPTVTVYQPEIFVTIINQVTVIVNIYDVAITTIIAGKPYTFAPAPKTTVTETKGTQTIVVVKPTSQAAVPPVTTTVSVGDVVSTVVYVPAAGPTSTKGAPAPSANAPAPTYQYNPTGSVCVCPLPTTVTHYVTVQTSSQPTTAPAATPTTPIAASNCAAPAIAASPTLFPGFIIPVQAANPATAYGTQYSANINANQEVVFQFNIRSTGKCSLNLGLPPISQLTTSSWAVTGDAMFSLAKLPTSVDQSLTFAKLPTSLQFTDFTATQSATTAIGSTFDCVAGTTATFVLKSKNGASMSFFEDYNCPYVGLSLVQA